LFQTFLKFAHSCKSPEKAQIATFLLSSIAASTVDAVLQTFHALHKQTGPFAPFYLTSTVLGNTAVEDRDLHDLPVKTVIWHHHDLKRLSFLAKVGTCTICTLHQV